MTKYLFQGSEVGTELLLDLLSRSVNSVVEEENALYTRLVERAGEFVILGEEAGLGPLPAHYRNLRLMVDREVRMSNISCVFLFGIWTEEHFLA